MRPVVVSCFFPFTDDCARIGGGRDSADEQIIRLEEVAPVSLQKLSLNNVHLPNPKRDRAASTRPSTIARVFILKRSRDFLLSRERNVVQPHTISGAEQVKGGYPEEPAKCLAEWCDQACAILVTVKHFVWRALRVEKHILAGVGSPPQFEQLIIVLRD